MDSWPFRCLVYVSRGYNWWRGVAHVRRDPYVITYNSPLQKKSQLNNLNITQYHSVPLDDSMVFQKDCGRLTGNGN